MMMARIPTVLVMLLLTAWGDTSSAATIDLPSDVHTLAFDEALVLARPGRGGRAPTHTDAVEHLLVLGQWDGATVGNSVELPDGSSLQWESVDANDDGWIQHQSLRGGYAFITVHSATDRIMVLDASGHSMVTINGVPRAGDPYGLGFLQIPVTLHAGDNQLLFRVGRGRVKARLVDPERSVTLMARDITKPDIIRGEPWASPIGIRVMNASTDARDDLKIIASSNMLPVYETTVPTIGPMTIRKVPFHIGGHLPPDVDHIAISIRLIDGTGVVLDEHELRLNVRKADQKHTRTFISAIDGSVQYFAVTPMPGDAELTAPPALFLSLHGASVQATNQAFSYEPKDWGVVVAPTNRRPFGFDWEDWGRLDALEVLAIAERRYTPDPDRIFLTGHSMGGHGTWQLAAHFPDRFAAIGPSAGWRSFASYGGVPPFDETDPVDALLKRAAAASDTLLLSRNSLHHGIYILHGDADDNVPVTQARFMKEHLDAFHHDLAYHEQLGAGHWWGNQCMDWPAMFSFFKDRARPATRDRVEFHTVNPGISDQSRWVRTDAQHQALAVSTVIAEVDREARQIHIETTNVARLGLDIEQAIGAGPATIALDGQTLDIEDDDAHTVWLEHAETAWSIADPLSSDSKTAQRAGPFKDAFRHRMVFVYGTTGTPAEQQWAYAKARFDAETFYYRGNGAVDIVADTDFDPAAEPDRSVILYGNADTNAAWSALLETSPVQVRRGAVHVGEAVESGDDLACLFIRPRPGSATASIAVITGTGDIGNRVTERIPVFVSGVAFPDVTILHESTLANGTAGVRAAGFFGIDWSVEHGDFAWRDN